MSLLSTVFGGPVFDVVGKVLDRVIPDPEAKAEAQLKLLELAQRGELAQLEADTKLAFGQLEINKEEAKHANLFVAGWRPAVGWVCVAGIGYTFVVGPLIASIANAFGAHMVLVDVQTTELLILIGGMLGIGTMRTFEKSQGVATSVGGKILTPVHKAVPTLGAVAPQDTTATSPAPVVPVQPDTATATSEQPKSRWIK